MASESFENLGLSSMADDESTRFSETPLSSMADDGSTRFSDIPMSEPFTGPSERRPGRDKKWGEETEAIDDKVKKKGRRPEPDDGGVTVIDLPASVKIDPAVGWLVCIEGVDKGRFFRLVKGNNSIGRPGNGNKYDVELSDQAISRKTACGMVVYDEKSNRFYVTPETGSNVNPYLNDEILLAPQLLTPRAVLAVAGDVLVFVPFCCDKFKWNFAKPQEQQPQAETPQPGNRREMIVRCEKGHFYNAAMNSSCPYCAAAEEENDPDGETKMY